MKYFPHRDYYMILGIFDTRAPAARIKTEYRNRMREGHPDRKIGAEAIARATEHAKLLNEAYGVLSDPSQRAVYDASRRQYYEHYDKARMSLRQHKAKSVHPVRIAPQRRPQSVLGELALRAFELWLLNKLK